MKLRVVTPPTVEPVTIADVKTHTHVSHDEEDLLIQSWIKSGRELAESYQRRAYNTQTLELAFDSWPEMPLALPRSPLLSIVSLIYTDYLGVATTFYDGTHTTNLIVSTTGEPGRINLAYNVTWPAVTLQSIDAVKIQFTAGYGATAASVSENVKDAIYLYCAWRYENRTAEAGSVPDAFRTLLCHDRCW